MESESDGAGNIKKIFSEEERNHSRRALKVALLKVDGLQVNRGSLDHAKDVKKKNVQKKRGWWGGWGGGGRESSYKKGDAGVVRKGSPGVRSRVRR